MKRDDLIDIDEKSLPNVTLTEEQKDKLRKSFRKSLKRFNENNFIIPIDSSPENIKRIEDNLGTNKDDIIHGVKHARVLKELSLEAAIKDCQINDDSIVLKKFFQMGAGMEAKDATPSLLTGVFYCYIIVSKDLFISYSFDNHFRFLSKRTIPIKEIESVGLSSDYKNNLKLTNENLIINITHKCKEQVSGFWLASKNPNDSYDLIEMKNLLLNLGVNHFIPRFFEPGMVFYMFFMGFFVFIMLMNTFSN